MNIVLFAHPAFMPSQSMPRFAGMLAEAYRARGHQVQIWSPQAVFYRLLAKSRFAKWAGYIDQYLLFPMQVRWRLLAQPADQLYVFCDQALGPWVPLVKRRFHVVHAHDLLALRSALGLIPENPTSATGRLYQRFIRWGFCQARHFIAVSARTQSDLADFAGIPPAHVTVVHNGLNQVLTPMPAPQAQALLQSASWPAWPHGYLLHVGGSQWYKNTVGIVKLYQHHAERRLRAGLPVMPLVMVSPPPNERVREALAQLPSEAKVCFFQGLSSETLRAAYSSASAFLFPSLAEGFGWPIVEAQACGALVLTTQDSPMNEVGGPAPCYVPRFAWGDDIEQWAEMASLQLDELLALDAAQRSHRVEQGLQWASTFTEKRAIEAYLVVYQKVLQAL